MNSKFKISIPKPCHENWKKMTPKEKGRFCSSCSKTVVDFTKKSTEEIENFLTLNKNNKVCGHFYKQQLDSIVIEIPQITFQQPLSFQKLFVLALFFVMGTTLFSCMYSDGKKQKIKNIVILDSLKTVDKDAGFIDSVEDEIDSLKTRSKKDTIATNNNNIKLTTLTTTGITICETDFTKDSTNNSKRTEDILEVIETTGELAIEGDINFTDEIEEDFDDIIMGYIVEHPPKFKEAKNLTQEKANKDFNERIQHFIQENFDTKLTENLDLAEGKYRVFTQFIIDKYGNMTDIKVKAPHPKLKNEVFKMLQKLPQLIPATQAGKAVKTKYTLPISFVVE